MKLKNLNLFNMRFVQSLQKLSETNLENVVDIILITKLLRTTREESKLVYNIRNQIFEEFGAKVEGNGVVFEDEDKSKLKEFADRINTLFEHEFEIPLDHKIKLTDKIAAALSPADILELEDILEIG